MKFTCVPDNLLMQFFSRFGLLDTAGRTGAKAKAVSNTCRTSPKYIQNEEQTLFLTLKLHDTDLSLHTFCIPFPRECAAQIF